MNYWLRLLLLKVCWLFYRLGDIVRWFPLRLARVIRHLYTGVVPGRYNWWTNDHRPNWPKRIGFWWLEFLLLTLDAMGIMEYYESLMDFVKFNSRPLTKSEREAAHRVFGEQLDYRRIRLDAKAIIGPSWTPIAYVSGYHVNYWRKISKAILLHELTHVWQYQQVGLVYISRALWAQQTTEGYDYGGPQKVWERVQSGGLLNDFNYEQQAEIVADYFRMIEGQRPEYHYGVNAQPAIYAGLLGGMKQLEA